MGMVKGERLEIMIERRKGEVVYSNEVFMCKEG